MKNNGSTCIITHLSKSHLLGSTPGLFFSVFFSCSFSFSQIVCNVTLASTPSEHHPSLLLCSLPIDYSVLSFVLYFYLLLMNMVYYYLNKNYIYAYSVRCFSRKHQTFYFRENLQLFIYKLNTSRNKRKYTS